MMSAATTAQRKRGGDVRFFPLRVLGADCWAGWPWLFLCPNVSADSFSASNFFSSSALKFFRPPARFAVRAQGFITHKEIEKVCDFLTPEATQQLIKEVDSNMDGKINFGECTWLEAITDRDSQLVNKLKGKIEKACTKMCMES
jgi:hypothetical protein